MLAPSSGPVYFASVARRYLHDGHIVEAARFMGNGPEIAAWAGGSVDAAGFGLSGTLVLWTDGAPAEVPMGDWVVRDGEALSIVPQELFASAYRQVG
jgi:hypothetical protein